MSIVPAAGISNAFKSLAEALSAIVASGKRQMQIRIYIQTRFRIKSPVQVQDSSAAVMNWPNASHHIRIAGKVPTSTPSGTAMLKLVKALIMPISTDSALMARNDASSSAKHGVRYRR
jgi:hypothetical protein